MFLDLQNGNTQEKFWQTLIPPITLENHSADSRIKLDESGTIQTLTSRMRMGGNNVPMVMGGTSYPDSIAYGVCSKNSNAIKSDNPNSGFYEAKTAKTLDCNAENAPSNQEGIIILQGSMIGRNSQNGPKGNGIALPNEYFALSGIVYYARIM